MRDNRLDNQTASLERIERSSGPKGASGGGARLPILILGLMMAIAVIASAAIVIGTQEVSDADDFGPCGAAVTYTYTSETKALAIAGTGTMNNYAYGEAPWDAYKDEIEALTIASGVTSIGDQTFVGCANLSGALTIPDSVTYIGVRAFDGCAQLTGALTIPDSVTYIGVRAFAGCSGFDGDLTIPDSVTYLGSSAFNGCSGFDGDLTISNAVCPSNTIRSTVAPSLRGP